MVNAVLRYASGATGVIQAATAFQPGYPERLEFHGTRGTAASKVRTNFRRAGKRIETLLPNYERLWLARNRPGGMPDSTARLRDLAASLKAAASINGT